MQAVIYDMDGVIVDSEPVHLGAILHVFHKIGITDLKMDDLYVFQGMSDTNICQQMVEKYHLRYTAEQLVKAKRYVFFQHMHEDGPVAIPHVLDLIEYTHQLRQQGIKTAVASSASMPEIDFITKALNIHKKFDTLQSGNELPKSKPDPAIYLKTAAILRVDPRNCVVLEDAEKGVQAAKSAGMYCIGFKSPHTLNQDLSKADVVVDDMRKAKEIVASLAKE